MNGFRQVAQTSKKEQIKNMDAELKNTQMAMRVMQTLVQNLLRSNKNLSDDLANTIGLVNELQYKILAIQSVGNLSTEALSVKADELKLKDFDDASSKKDAEDNLVDAETVTEDSTVVITSTTEGTDKGIFRSRFTMAECNIQDLRAALLSQRVGTKTKVKLNDQEHVVELLSVKQPAATQTETEVAV
jgi:hypothetical protein